VLMDEPFDGFEADAADDGLLHEMPVPNRGLE